MNYKRMLERYIFPNILAMVGTSCYILADTFFISMAKGANGITALNLVLPIYGLIYAIGSMIGIGAATRYTLTKAQGDKDADAFFSNALFWDLILSVIFIGVGYFYAEEILRALGADDTILALGEPYLKIIIFFTPFFLMNYAFTAFTRNDGAPKLAMAATLISGLFNIVFDYVLMFPCQLGMAGAALATAISPVISIIICLFFHFLTKKNTIVFARRLPSFRRLLTSCSLGVAPFVGEISSGITTLIFNYLLLALGGNLAVAAYGVLANIALVATGIFNGVSQGLQPAVSALHGLQDAKVEKELYGHARRIAVAIAVLVVAVVLVFAPGLTDIFNSEGSEALRDMAVPALRIYFVGFLLAAVNIVKAGFYSATGQARASAVIAISRGIVAITLMAVLLSRFLGITGVWLAFPAAELVTWLISPGVKKQSFTIR